MTRCAPRGSAWRGFNVGSRSRANTKRRHRGSSTIPTRSFLTGPPTAELRVLIGSAYGCTSPVTAVSPTFYVDAQLDAEAELELPDGYAERAAYVAEGSSAPANGSSKESSLCFEPAPR